MTTLEQVDKLRERANVTYDEAKEALDASDGNILEAMIYLERQGKAEPPKNGGYYSTKTESEKPIETGDKKKEEKYQSGVTFAALLGKIFRWIAKIIAKGNVNSFEVHKNSEIILSIPVTVLVLILFFAFWIVVPLLVIGLFFGCRYFFKGPDLEHTGVNNFMDSASEAAENFKKEVKEENK